MFRGQRSSGYGFVHYKLKEDAEKAVEALNKKGQYQLDLISSASALAPGFPLPSSSARNMPLPFLHASDDNLSTRKRASVEALC